MKHKFTRDILVTGAGGRLAQRLVQAWRADPADASIVTVSREHAGDIRWSPGDTMDVLPHCDTIIALWGVTSGNAATLEANSRLAETAHDLAIRLGARRVLHMSSAGVYGPGQDMTESATLPKPVTQYGQSKLRMEQRVAQLADRGAMAHCCLRLANVVGADSLAPALNGDRPACLDRFSNGQGPARSYIAPTMLMRVLDGLSALPPDKLPSVVNVAAQRPVAMADLLSAAGRQISWREAPQEAVQTVTLDVSRLASILPEVVLETDAKAMIDDFKRTNAGR